MNVKAVVGDIQVHALLATYNTLPTLPVNTEEEWSTRRGFK